jgi:SAM-dependent methyltransferase
MATQSQPPAASTAGAFDESHAGRMRSTAVEAIYRSAFGEDNPAAAQPSAFYSATTLQTVISALDLRPGRVLADLGCGHGGPGLWAAQQTGATLIGIDLSPAGIELARRRAVQLGLDARARFTAGDLTATGLPDASCDAVMSLDVLPFAPGKAAALREVARILRPGGRFAFTTWEQLTHPVRGDEHDPHRQALADTFHGHPLLQSAHTDYRQLTEQAGLTVETSHEPPGWRHQQQALAEGIVAAESDITSDMGAHYPAMARVFLANLPNVRYILTVARRPGGVGGQDCR